MHNRCTADDLTTQGYARGCAPSARRAELATAVVTSSPQPNTLSKPARARSSGDRAPEDALDTACGLYLGDLPHRLDLNPR